MSKTKASSIENSGIGVSSPNKDFLSPREISSSVSYFPLRLRESQQHASKSKDPKSILERLRKNKLAAGFTQQHPIQQTQVKETTPEPQRDKSRNSVGIVHHQRTLTWTDLEHMGGNKEESAENTL
jgi:hypothetical protein